MNTLHLTCENPDELIAGFGAGARINLQTSTTETGSYSNVTFIALTAATRSYTYEHLAGVSSTWYKVRFEDSTGANANDYGDPFQVGDENAGLLCSLYDVQQELGDSTSANDTELIIEKIRQVSRAIEKYTERWLAPRPSSGTKVLTIHTLCGQSLHFERGVRNITTLALATEDQPESGGTYTTVTSTDYYIDPPTSLREPGEPGYWITMRSQAASWFYDASFGAQVTGAFGFASVPPDINGVAIRAVTRRVLGKSGGGALVAVGPNGTDFLLPDMSGADRLTLDQYKRGQL